MHTSYSQDLFRGCPQPTILTFGLYIKTVYTVIDPVSGICGKIMSFIDLWTTRFPLSRSDKLFNNNDQPAAAMYRFLLNFDGRYTITFLCRNYRSARSVYMLCLACYTVYGLLVSKAHISW